eukprot:g12750.t1
MIKFNYGCKQDSIVAKIKNIFKQIPEEYFLSPQTLKAHLWQDQSDNLDYDQFHQCKWGEDPYNPEKMKEAARNKMDFEGDLEMAEKAALIAAGLTALIHYMPKILCEWNNDQDPDQSMVAFKRLLGPICLSSLQAAGTAGIRTYLRMALGPAIGTPIGIMAVESICATWAWLNGDTAGATCLKYLKDIEKRTIEAGYEEEREDAFISISSAAIAMAFPPAAWEMMLFKVIEYVFPEIKEAQKNIESLVMAVIMFTTNHAGIAATLTGVGIYLGGGTISAGGYGIVGGNFVLTAVPGIGQAIAVSGAAYLVYKAFQYKPENISEVVESLKLIPPQDSTKKKKTAAYQGKLLYKKAMGMASGVE